MLRRSENRISFPIIEFNHQRWILLAGLIFLMAVIARILPGPRIIDDAYITYRYTRNILAGNGFVYNPGEHVLGTTTPLYTFLLSLLGQFSGKSQAPFPLLSVFANALADGLTCLLLINLGRRLGSPLAGCGAAVVWAIAPYSVTFAIGGLETSLYVLLLTATMSAYLEQRFVWAMFFGSLALLTRPDALILLGPLLVDRFFLILTSRRSDPISRQMRSILYEAAAFLIPLLPWVIFAFYYFGSPLPHSIAAKSLAYRLPADAALIRLMQHYATPFLENLTFGIPAIGVGMILYLFLFMVGAFHTFRAQRSLWPWLIFPWLYFLAFAIANPLIFRWYLTPPLPAYFLIILAGIERIIQQLFFNREPPDSPGNNTKKLIGKYLAISLVVLAPFILTLRGWTLHPDHGANRPTPEMAYIKLELLYQQAAESLRAEISSHSTLPLLAAGDVGVLGYFTAVRILDTVGLNSPISTSYYPLDPALYVINYAIPPDLILDQRPDYVVILEVYGRESLLKDSRFQSTYHLRQKIPTDMYGSDGMLILEEKK